MVVILVICHFKQVMIMHFIFHTNAKVRVFFSLKNIYANVSVRLMESFCGEK